MSSRILSQDLQSKPPEGESFDLALGETRKPILISIVGRPEHGLCPVSFGVPLAKSQFVPNGRLAELSHADGARVPAQIQALAYWPDGSAQWILVDAILPGGLQADKWFLNFQTQAQGEAETSRIGVTSSDSSIAINTGLARFQLHQNSADLFTEIGFEDKCSILLGMNRLSLRDRRGGLHPLTIHAWHVESPGPLRATAVGVGFWPRLGGLRAECRLNFFASTGIVKAEIRLHNPQRARHPGGIWDLGDRGSVFFQDISWQLAFESAEAAITKTDFSVERGSPFREAHSLHLYQGSSGGENWQSQNHVTAEGIVPCRFRGYQMAVDGVTSTGLRAEPTVQIQMSSGRISLAVPEFWQQFPKAISARPHEIRIGLFPQEQEHLYELQGGEQKTLNVWFQFESCDSKPMTLSWVHHPVSICGVPKDYDTSQILPRLDLPESHALTRFENYLNESRATVLANREKVDEYGWRNYGDVFADHEQTYYPEADLLISHYNNQFDMIHGFLLHYLRTGDVGWWELGDALARHVADIDIYHTQQDKAAYNGGLFWFTDHYLHAKTSTHRTYSRSNRPPEGDYGGGPCAKHNFTTGLLLHYYLTGHPSSRDAVLELSDWVIAMDDGWRTILGILDEGKTGLACGGFDQAPDRAGGNSINALLDAWQVSRDRKYLNYAEVLIKRSVHPEENVAARNLLDVENHWSYTVFLTALAKYLNTKEEVGEFDGAWEYARESLLNYARWMLLNEKPYFDQAEQLEFPTEAWAAQEFRKANVLRQAARLACAPLQSQLLTRGEQFADRAWQDLLRFETRHYARAFAVVMIEGLIDCQFRFFPCPSTKVDLGSNDFPKADPFISQRQRIRWQLRSAKGVYGLLANLLKPKRWIQYYRSRHSAELS